MGGTEEESLLQPLCGGRDGGTARVLSGARRAQAFAALERVKVVGREVPPGRVLMQAAASSSSSSSS